MAATLPILNAFKERLNKHFPDWDIRLMPDEPSSYFLAHPNGAVLISYAGSKFSDVRPTQLVTQTRTVHIVLTVMCRNLHNDFGVIHLLDRLRLAVVGFRPPSCEPTYLLEEQFGEQESGIWIYQLALATKTVQVECSNDADQAIETLPKFAKLIARQQGEPLDARLKPKL